MFPPAELYDNDLLYDLEQDPTQNTTIHDPETEKRLGQAMIEMMRENDAPKDQYERIGFKAPADAK